MQFSPTLRNILRLLVAGTIATLPVLANAFQMSPAVATMEPTGLKSEQIYLLTNTSSGPAAVQFKVLTRQQREDGSEVRDPASSLFGIFPTQTVIPAGGTQKVRVKWQGASSVSGEQAFRFIAKQVPVQLGKADSISVNVNMTLEAALYVRPTGSPEHSVSGKPAAELPVGESSVANPDQTGTAPDMLKVVKVQAVNTPDGQQLSVTLNNPTRNHIILNNISLTLSSEMGKPISLSGEQLGKMVGQNLLAGATRNFIMPLPAGFDPQRTWQAQLQATH